MKKEKIYECQHITLQSNAMATHHHTLVVCTVIQFKMGFWHCNDRKLEQIIIRQSHNVCAIYFNRNCTMKFNLELKSYEWPKLQNYSLKASFMSGDNLN